MAQAVATPLDALICFRRAERIMSAARHDLRVSAELHLRTLGLQPATLAKAARLPIATVTGGYEVRGDSGTHLVFPNRYAPGGFSCDCSASRSRCSHVGAVLMHLYRLGEAA